MAPKTKKNLQYEYRPILDNHCRMLVPMPITNSGDPDGGWMDRIGIASVGVAMGNGGPYPADGFYSNDAYKKFGFTTLNLELRPVLSSDDDVTYNKESLKNDLMLLLRQTENEYFDSSNPREFQWLDDISDIDDPASIQSSATSILHVHFETMITPGPNIPRGLTADTRAAIIHFANKGNIILKANNLGRHDPKVDYLKILGSIEYTGARMEDRSRTTSLNFGSLMQMIANPGGGMSPDMRSIWDESMRKAAEEIDAADAAAAAAPKCLGCGRVDRVGETLRACARCQKVMYCSRECQKNDWKRHKKAECAGK